MILTRALSLKTEGSSKSSNPTSHISNWAIVRCQPEEGYWAQHSTEENLLQIVSSTNGEQKLAFEYRYHIFALRFTSWIKRNKYIPSH
jgi:hypothetical protein